MVQSDVKSNEPLKNYEFLKILNGRYLEMLIQYFWFSSLDL